MNKVIRTIKYFLNVMQKCLTIEPSDNTLIDLPVFAFTKQNTEYCDHLLQTGIGIGIISSTLDTRNHKYVKSIWGLFIHTQ